MKKTKQLILQDNTNHLTIAIDIGSKTHWMYWCDERGREGKSLPFANTRKGLDQMWVRISAARQKTAAESVTVGFESSGPYTKPVAYYFAEKPVRLVQVNPMHTKRAKELNDNSPLKSDKKDPKVIAGLIRMGHHLEVVLPYAVMADLRHYIHSREGAVKDRTAAKNHLNQALSCLFPEFLSVFKDSETATVRYLLRQYPLPRMVMELGEDELTAQIEKVSRKRLGRKHAQALRQGAAHTLGVQEGTNALQEDIQDALETIERTTARIDRLEDRIAGILEEIPCSQYLLSVKGVGIITAAGILGEVVDFDAYPTAASLLKMAGLNLYEVSSGVFKGTRRITKRGRALLRKFLYCASANMVKKDGILHDYYHRLRGRDKHTQKAMVAVMRKLLRILYALVRDRVPYDHTFALRRAA
jgi:transposase